jgi:hypothetical protein
MKVADLKELCKAVGLPVSGKKSDLIERLLEAAGTTQPAGDADSADVPDSQQAHSADHSQITADDQSADTSPLGGGIEIDNTATTNDMLVEGRYRLFTQV